MILYGIIICPSEREQGREGADDAAIQHDRNTRKANLNSGWLRPSNASAPCVLASEPVLARGSRDRVPAAHESPSET